MRKEKRQTLDFEGAQTIKQALNYKTADHVTFAPKMFSEGPEIISIDNNDLEFMGTIKQSIS